MRIDMEIDQDDNTVSLDVKEVYQVGTGDDYEKLKNKPRLNGRVIVGDMEETDPTIPGWAKSPTKPQYTAEELNALSKEDAITLTEIDEIFKGL